jgi:hypothetical protein
VISKSSLPILLLQPDWIRIAQAKISGREKETTPMNIRRLSIAALLLLSLVYCGGDGTAPIEEVKKPEVPTAEVTSVVDEPAGEEPAPVWFSAVDAINVDQNRLGWKGFHLDATRESIEAKLGRELSLEKIESPYCGGYIAYIEDDEMKVEIEFESSEPGAKLEILSIPLPPFSGDKAKVVERLKSRIPNLVYQPSIHAPDLLEDDNDGPLYLLRDNPGHVVIIKPWEDIIIALSYCLD